MVSIPFITGAYLKDLVSGCFAKQIVSIPFITGAYLKEEIFILSSSADSLNPLHYRGLPQSGLGFQFHPGGKVSIPFITGAYLKAHG